MRIGLELLGTQTLSRHRGIGRYCRNLATALLAEGPGHEFVLLADATGPLDLLPSAFNARPRLLQPKPTIGDAIDQYARDNPDDLDLLILTSPFELEPGHNIPIKPDGLRIAAVVYDVIPLIFQADYLLKLPREAEIRRYVAIVDRLRSYDQLLLISDATRVDIARYVKVPEERLVTIGTGVDDPALDCGGTDGDSVILARLGLNGQPFIYTVGASDPRKNLGGLIEAFGRLPRHLAASRKLVITAGLSAEERRPLIARAKSFGVADRLIFTGVVSDEVLRSLYRRCEVFVFSSLYEGFGLPIVEALRHGAAVVAGRNSSQIEAAGDAALLVNNSDPSSIAEGIERLLNDPALTQTLKSRAFAQSRKFQWSRCAQILLEAVEGPIPKPAVSSPPRPAGRSRLAWLSPLPPNPSGVSDYSRALLPAMEEDHVVDLFSDGRGVPFARFENREASCLDARVFHRFAKSRSYDAIIYQIGNSRHHLQAYQAAMSEPGIVVLHDLDLIALHLERTNREGGGGFQGFLNELALEHPDRFEAYQPRFETWNGHPEIMMAELIADGVTMTRRLAEHAKALIVHSRWGADRLSALSPAIARKTFVVPQGAELRPGSPSGKADARARLDLPPDALLIGVFGNVHPSKLNAETVEAFAELAKRHREAVLLFIGHEIDNGLARDKARSLGLETKVRFLGRPDDQEFHDLIAACDLGVNLRSPAFEGEPSGSLFQMLGAGLPTIVTDSGSHGELDPSTVRKLSWRNHREGIASLAEGLIELAESAESRQALAAAAIESIRRRHLWTRVAAEYSKVIDFVGKSNASLYKTNFQMSQRKVLS